MCICNDYRVCHLKKWPPLFFNADLPKTLLFHLRICMSLAWKVSHFGEISQKHVRAPVGAPLHRRKALHRCKSLRSSSYLIFAQNFVISLTNIHFIFIWEISKKLVRQWAHRSTCVKFVNEIKFWANIKYVEDLRDLRLFSALRLWSGAPTGVRVFG